LDLKNHVGLEVDGCSTMLGEKKGLAMRIKKTSPSLISFYCPTHRIQVAIRDISKLRCKILLLTLITLEWINSNY